MPFEFFKNAKYCHFLKILPIAIFGGKNYNFWNKAFFWHSDGNFPEVQKTTELWVRLMFWYVHPTGCQINGFIGFFFGVNSMMTLAAMSWGRLLVITSPKFCELSLFNLAIWVHSFWFFSLFFFLCYKSLKYLFYFVLCPLKHNVHLKTIDI